MKDTTVILIAEDDSGHFVLAKRCLRNAGFKNEVLRFVDGENLLDFLMGRTEGHVYDSRKKYILLLDIRMPKADGIEILQTVKANSDWSNIPVIIITTSDASANILRCRALGCDGYVIKPLGENLIEAIKAVSADKLKLQ